MRRADEHHDIPASVTSRRLVGAPPSAAAMRSAAKELKTAKGQTTPKMERKRSINTVETEDSGEESDGAKTSEEMEEGDSKPVESGDLPTTPTTTEKKRKRKRRIRLTDSGLKAKRKAEKREKQMVDQKNRTEDQQVEDEAVGAKSDVNECQKEEEAEKQPTSSKERPRPEDLSPFQLFCDNILRRFYLKDPEGYFANPVSNDEAPDYSSIIKNPMSFSAIRERIEQDEYSTIADFRSDVELIVSNAKEYNPVGTLYYLAAEKLATLAKYYFSEKYLIYLQYVLPFGRMVPSEKLGMRPKREENQQTERSVDKERERMLALIKDSASSKELIDSAPKSIKDRLTTRRPNCHLVYFDNRDGAIALNFLTPKPESEESTELKLGDLIKPLERGNPGMCTPFEPKINQHFPVMTYTNPGPFASFAPQYDSTWATLSKRDSALLLSCYGDKSNVADTFSLRQMISNTSDAFGFFEDMMDELTDGEHQKTVAELEGKELEKPEIDSNTLDWRLQSTGKKIQELASLQNKRLSMQPPLTLVQAPLPDQSETELANEIVQELGQHVLNEGVKPRDIVSTAAVHQSLGLDEDEFEILSEFLEVS